MRYEYQIDYGDGSEETFPTEQTEPSTQRRVRPRGWLWSKRKRPPAARVLSGGEVVEEPIGPPSVMHTRPTKAQPCADALDRFPSPFAINAVMPQFLGCGDVHPRLLSIDSHSHLIQVDQVSTPQLVSLISNSLSMRFCAPCFTMLASVAGDSGQANRSVITSLAR